MRKDDVEKEKDKNTGVGQNVGGDCDLNICGIAGPYNALHFC